MLEIKGLTVAALGKTVVDNVSVTVRPSQVTALLGANGAGKSELVLAIAGLMPVTGGSVTANGIAISGAKPDAIRAAGVAAVPEGHHVLTQLTVDENLAVAGSILSVADAAEAMAEVYAIFPELAERKQQLAGTLSGGQQQMVAIGHALMARPKYILIDEISLGLAPLIVKRLSVVVGALAGKGIGVLLVEQFVEVALALATEVVVLRKGAVRLVSDPAALRADPALLTAAYL